MRRCRLTAACLVALLLLARSLAIAQPANGARGPEGVRPPAEAAAPQAPEEATAAAAPQIPESAPAAVRAVLATAPKTPDDCIRTAKVLADLGEPQLAKPLLHRVIEAKLDQDALVELEQRFGTALFLALTNRPELQPEAQQITTAVLEATRRRLQDPQQLAALVTQLRDTDDAKRAAAATALIKARGAAVAPLVALLADPARQAEHGVAREILTQSRDDAIGPLLAILDQPDPRLAATAVQLLANTQAADARLFLFAPLFASHSEPAVREAAAATLRSFIGQMPSAAEAANLLMTRAEEYLEHRRPPGQVVEGQVETWTWDETAKTAIVRLLPSDEAARRLAARLARDAHTITPGDPRARTLFLATLLNQAAFDRGLDQPLAENSLAVQQAVKFGPRVVEDVLRYALAHRQPVIGTAAARILGHIGRAEELLSQGPGHSPLTLALQQADRRWRFAAAEAIVRLRPTKPYPGSSYVPQTLAYFAATSGRPHVLLAGPKVAEMREMAGVLSEKGWEAISAPTGRQALDTILASPDYQAALIDVQIDQPPVEVLLQQLRRDPRSADLRVALLAREGRLEQAEKVARRDGRAMAFPRPHDDASLRWQLDRLSTIAPQSIVGPEERNREAAASLELLAELFQAPPGLYNFRQFVPTILAAVGSPLLGPKAIEIAGRLNAPEAQRELVDLGSRVVMPIEVRKAAAQAFVNSIERHGILLTAAEIQQQYDRYNQSATLDKDTQRVLGVLLDALETPSKVDQAKPGTGRESPNNGPQ